jgi:hypothetical protein
VGVNVAVGVTEGLTVGVGDGQLPNPSIVTV